MLFKASLHPFAGEFVTAELPWTKRCETCERCYEVQPLLHRTHASLAHTDHPQRIGGLSRVASWSYSPGRVLSWAYNSKKKYKYILGMYFMDDEVRNEAVVELHDLDAYSRADWYLLGCHASHTLNYDRSSSLWHAMQMREVVVGRNLVRTEVVVKYQIEIDEIPHDIRTLARTQLLGNMKRAQDIDNQIHGYLKKIMDEWY